MTKWLIGGTALGAAGLVLLAAPVTAQSFRNHDSSQPVVVDADRAEANDRTDRAVFSGNVRASQGNLSLDAARVTVAYSKAGGGGGIDIDRLDASGGVVVRSGSDVARGNVAIYDLNRRIITMVGGVTLNQGVNRLTGGRLVIDLNSGRSVMDGSAVGGNNGVSGSAGGRVSGRFTVPQRKTN